MLNIMFFIKTTLLAVLLVACLQVKSGGETWEIHATRFIQTSELLEPLREAAHNGAVVLQKGISWVSHQVSSRIWNRRKSADSRASTFELRWSEAYESEKQQEN